MRTPRSAIVGIATLVMLGLAAAGCGTSPRAVTDPFATPSPSSVDPKAALLASFTAVGKSSANVTVKQGGLTGSAKTDPAGKKAQVSLRGPLDGGTLKVDVISINPDVWVKVDLGALNAQLNVDPTKWAKVDLTKLQDGALPIDTKGDTDVLDLPKLFTGLGEVKQADATHLSGTMDLTKATGDSAFSADDLKTIGSKASKVPFTAVVDDQGRLTKLTIQTGDPKTAMDITITGYGAPQTINPPPASSVVTAGTGVYNLLNS